MKAMIFVLSMLSVSAFAAPKKEVIRVRGTFSLHTLRCEVRLGSQLPRDQRMITVLGDKTRELDVLHANLGLKLKHTGASLAGCDLKKLDAIKDRSIQYYGFIHDAPVEITRETSESRRNGFGQCIASFDETVKMSLGQGIVLESSEDQLIAATDCH